MSDVEKQDAELKRKCQEKLRNVTESDTMEKVRLTVLSRGSGSIKGIGRFVSLYILSQLVMAGQAILDCSDIYF
jgi:hypothetical protein